MYGNNPERAYNNLSEQQQAKLQKIKELTSILKDTDKNLTICEEILTTYIRKRLRVEWFLTTIYLPRPAITIPSVTPRIPTVASFRYFFIASRIPRILLLLVISGHLLRHIIDFDLLFRDVS